MTHRLAAFFLLLSTSALAVGNGPLIHRVLGPAFPPPGETGVALCPGEAPCADGEYIAYDLALDCYVCAAAPASTWDECVGGDIQYADGGVYIGDGAVGCANPWCVLDGGPGDLHVEDDVEVSGDLIVYCDPGVDGRVNVLIGTADAADHGSLELYGGGGNTASRSAGLRVKGNEFGVGAGGTASLFGGDVATGDCVIQTANASAEVRLFAEAGATDNRLIQDATGWALTSGTGDTFSIDPAAVIVGNGTAPLWAGWVGGDNSLLVEGMIGTKSWVDADLGVHVGASAELTSNKLAWSGTSTIEVPGSMGARTLKETFDTTDTWKVRSLENGGLNGEGSFYIAIDSVSAFANGAGVSTSYSGFDIQGYNGESNLYAGEGDGSYCEMHLDGQTGLPNVKYSSANGGAIANLVFDAPTSTHDIHIQDPAGATQNLAFVSQLTTATTVHDTIFNTALLATIPLAGPLTNGFALRSSFDGSTKMPSTVTYEFGGFISITGAAAITIRLQDVTNAATLATITVPNGGAGTALAYFSTTTFANIPAGRALIEAQASVAAGTTATVDSLSLIAYR